MFTATIL